MMSPSFAQAVYPLWFDAKPVTEIDPGAVRSMLTPLEAVTAAAVLPKASATTSEYPFAPSASVVWFTDATVGTVYVAVVPL